MSRHGLLRTRDMERDDLSVELLSLLSRPGSMRKTGLGKAGWLLAYSEMSALRNMPIRNAANGRSPYVVVAFPNFTQSLRTLTFSMFRQASIQIDRHTEARNRKPRGSLCRTYFLSESLKGTERFMLCLPITRRNWRRQWWIGLIVVRKADE